MGDQESVTRAASTSMRILRDELTEPRARTVNAGPRARAVHAPPPIDLGLLDYLEQSRAELVGATRTVNPQAGPAPADEGIYEWSAAATAHLAVEKQAARDAIVYRQGLEHAIRAGDHQVIRRERCPACRCYSLLWRESIQRAVCIQDECRNGIGRAPQWHLRQLAHHHVTSRPQRAAN